MPPSQERAIGWRRGEQHTNMANTHPTRMEDVEAALFSHGLEFVVDATEGLAASGSGDDSGRRWSG
jgi:hypothetical protein